MRKFFILFVLILSTVSSLFATSTPEQIKTLFVFNFIKYIEWETKPTTYTIAYYGDDDALFAAFTQMAEQKSVGNTKITVERLSQISKASNYHLAYISEGYSGLIEQLPELKNTVVVSEKDGLAKKGSYINFVNQEGKIRFEVNKSKFLASNVKISSQLLSLAIKV